MLSFGAMLVIRRLTKGFQFEERQKLQSRNLIGLIKFSEIELGLNEI
jgi:hypothetical protein